MKWAGEKIAVFELHLLESGISGIKVCLWLRLTTRSFELHLLESGISGISNEYPLYEGSRFELHLLESGISGQGIYILSISPCMFELHLLESGISGNTARTPRPPESCV